MSRPEPLVPAEVDLRSLEYMPLYIATLKNSKTWLLTKRKPLLMRPLLALWIAAWQSVPAGSLEDDDDFLAHAAELTFDAFQDARDDLLRGWKRCSDGRLYLPSMVPMAQRGWALVLGRRLKGKAGAAKRWGNAAAQDASGNASGIPSGNSREGGREVGREVNRGSTSQQNGAKHPRIAFLEARSDLIAGRAIADETAAAIAGELKLDSTKALDDKREAFEARYLQRTSTPVEH